MFQLNRRYTVELPVGTISPTGIDLIGKFLEAQNMEDSQWQAKNPGRTGRYIPDLPDNWQYVWLVESGESYKGTFPKRVASFYRKQFGIKCPDVFTREIGNIARQYSNDESIFHFDVVDTIDWYAGDFGDSGSCYWGGMESSRYALESGGGMAIRFFNEDGDGYARAWMVKARTDVYVIFNGYGFYNHATMQIARIFATFLGTDYKDVRFDSDVYLNGDAFVVGETNEIERFNYFDYYFGVEDEDEEDWK